MADFSSVFLVNFFLGLFLYNHAQLINRLFFANLICHVEKWEQFSLFDDCADFLPLLGGRVHSGRVVGTGVKEDYGTLGDFTFLFLQSVI